MNIYICVGSSCHLKGSYDIIQLMKDAIESNQLIDQVNLSAAFCLGRCTDGVTVKINNEIICGVSKDNFPEFFEKHVLAKLQSTNP
jgi:NADH:ubiquinone oxidoreductase 24 kD subunit